MIDARSTSSLGANDEPMDRDWLSEFLTSRQTVNASKRKTTGNDTTSAQNNPDDRIIRRPEFIIVTWNIWFERYEWQARLEAALAETLEQDPDVFCFQEVRTEVHQCMLNCAFLRQRYYPAEGERRLPHGYDCSIWIKRDDSRIHSVSTTTVPFSRTIYGRRSLSVDLEVALDFADNANDHDARHCGRKAKIRVVASHLESGMGMAATRRGQLATLFSYIRNNESWMTSLFSFIHSSSNNNDSNNNKSSGDNSDNTNNESWRSDVGFLVGDFNLDPSYPENKFVDDNGTDVWKVLRPNDAGFTEDTFVNAMRYVAHGEHKQARYDRVVMVERPAQHAESSSSSSSSSSPVVVAVPQSINLLGTAPFEVDGRQVWASDHFGLVARAELQ